MHVTTPATSPRQSELAPSKGKNIPRNEQSLQTCQEEPLAMGCMFSPLALHAGGSARASSPPPPGMWLLDTGLLLPVPCLLQKSPLQLINYSRAWWDAGSWRCTARKGRGEPSNCLAVPHTTMAPQSQRGWSWVPPQCPNSQGGCIWVPHSALIPGILWVTFDCPAALRTTIASGVSPLISDSDTTLIPHI